MSRSMARIPCRLAVAIVGVLVVQASMPCFARPHTIPQDLTPQQIAARALPAVVRLTVRDQSGTPSASGSGIVVGTNLIITCWHVINGAHTVTANFSDGRSESVPGTICVDRIHDVALLSVPTGRVKPLPLGPVPPLGAGVVAIGNPEGLSGTVSAGLVSGVRMFESTRVVQTTAPISPGSSGGALLDARARVIGVVKAYYVEGQNLNFAVVSDYIRPLFLGGVARVDPRLVQAMLSKMSDAQLQTIARASKVYDPDGLKTWSALAAEQLTLNAALLESDLYIDKIKAALDHGADVNAKRNGGETMLYLAAFDGDLECSRFLIDRGADVNANDNAGRTVLMRAVSQDIFGTPALVSRLLIDRGAEVNAKMTGGWTALMLAAQMGHTDCVRLLLEHGADVNERSVYNGVTALIEVAGVGSSDCVRLLLDHGANVNDKSVNGTTALIAAVGVGSSDCVRLLLDHGAVVNAKNDLGQTALSEAKSGGHQDIVDALVAAGATE